MKWSLCQLIYKFSLVEQIKAVFLSVSVAFSTVYLYSWYSGLNIGGSSPCQIHDINAVFIWKWFWQGVWALSFCTMVVLWLHSPNCPPPMPFCLHSSHMSRLTFAAIRYFWIVLPTDAIQEIMLYLYTWCWLMDPDSKNFGRGKTFTCLPFSWKNKNRDIQSPCLLHILTTACLLMRLVCNWWRMLFIASIGSELRWMWHIDWYSCSDSWWRIYLLLKFCFIVLLL